MSHFAKVIDGIVAEVLVIEQDVIDTGMFGDPSLFVQTSYNTYGGQHPEGRPLRKNFAGIGYTYDPVRDAFIAPQPFRQIRHRKMVTRATATMDTPYFAVPADWKETIRFQLNTNPITALLYVTPEQLLEDSQVYSSAGQPMFFTTVGQQFEVLPQPDGSYDAELLYYAKLPALSDAAPTNWLLTESPDIYLYGTLAQSAPYLKEDERTAIWTSLYEKLVEDMRIADERARIGSSKLKPRIRTFG